MPSDYVAIKTSNIQRYGTDIGRIGPTLLAHRYHDRTHFIFELLQNAEDALARRTDWHGSRAVRFTLADGVLRVSHSGLPFAEPNVIGICGILESTKDLTSIGRFGIGFKSVYAFTSRPEIHSGDEHFAIESFVWPEEAPPIPLEPEETRFILPLNLEDQTAVEEITRGFQQLGPRVLLFLREIEEVSWSVKDGPSGLYVRDSAQTVGANARRITVIGQDHGAEEVTEETWLIFSKQACTPEGQKAGYVEIAFALGESKGDKRVSVRPVDNSALVVFFPTIVQTHTGCLIQGPYRTTPSRDNVPIDDAWNQYLVAETGVLLRESLLALRDMGLLNAGALRTLPIERSKFVPGSLFAPLFEAARDALGTDALIPRFGGGHVAARHARLARTQELRELISPTQLTELYRQEHEIAWISEDITQDRTHDLRAYLIQELKVPEVRPEDIVPLFTKEFLEKQTDGWIVRLYEFLNGQSAVTRSGTLRYLPLIRLESGTHVKPLENGQWQAFLPGSTQTGFPTVRRSVCGTEDALNLLKGLGLTEPDPVDDIVRNVLPRYRNAPRPSGSDYEADVRRIVNAFKTDSKSRREALVSALSDTLFLAAVDAATGKRYYAKPQGVYIATERLKGLFGGVAGVYLVDDSYDCLHGEDVRELLEACGATRYLEPLPAAVTFTWQEKAKMRREAGCESSSGGEQIEDFTIRGLKELLEALPGLDAPHPAQRAGLLWEALCDLEDRRGTRAFSGTYTWHYYRRQSSTFDAMFVRLLNEMPWIPARDGALQPPRGVLFEQTGWKDNQFLVSKIRFKPPIIETLAREAGIEPGVLDLLKKLGVTSEAELKARLGISAEDTPPESPSAAKGEESPEDALRKLGITGEPTPPVKAEGHDGSAGGSSGGTAPTGNSTAAGSESHTGTHVGGSSGNGAGSRTQGSSGHGHARTAGSKGGRPFISYVGAHPSEDAPDPDGVDHEQRLKLEEQAVSFVLAQDSRLRRTPTNNPGFDLVELDADGTPVRWVEVKAMTGDFQSRPVGLSHTQFETAQERGLQYWLYVVEHAGSPDEARSIRIQDPAGKALTFTFDHGWLNVAEPDHRALPIQHPAEEEQS